MVAECHVLQTQVLFLFLHFQLYRNQVEHFLKRQIRNASPICCSVNEQNQLNVQQFPTRVANSWVLRWQQSVAQALVTMRGRSREVAGAVAAQGPSEAGRSHADGSLPLSQLQQALGKAPPWHLVTVASIAPGGGPGTHMQQPQWHACSNFGVTCLCAWSYPLRHASACSGGRVQPCNWGGSP